MHVKVPAFCILINGPLKDFTELGPFLVALYCGSFGLCIALLAAQFVYRYLVVCRPEHSRFIAGYKCINVLWPCLIVFVLWFYFVYSGIEVDSDKMEDLKTDIFETYSQNVQKIGFAVISYWLPNGKWNFKALKSVIGFDLIIALCILIIIFCGLSIYRDLQKKENMMSERRMDLHRQLFFTLTFQTLLPFFLMYMTVGFVITSPLLSLEIGRFANIAGVTVAFYPSLEPCIAMFCIRDFRETLMC